jgi:hypothetical protein
MTPVKTPHTRVKPFQLAFASGHGRYSNRNITVTSERALVSVWEWPLHAYNRYKFVAVSIPKPPRGGRFASETAVRGCRSETASSIQKWLRYRKTIKSRI